MNAFLMEVPQLIEQEADRKGSAAVEGLRKSSCGTPIHSMLLPWIECRMRVASVYCSIVSVCVAS